MCWVLKDWFSLAYIFREPGNVLGFERSVFPNMYYERARKCVGFLKDWYSLAYTIRELGNVLGFERLVFPSTCY